MRTRIDTTTPNGTPFTMRIDTTKQVKSSWRANRTPGQSLKSYARDHRTPAGSKTDPLPSLEACIEAWFAGKHAADQPPRARPEYIVRARWERRAAKRGKKSNKKQEKKDKKADES